MTTASAALGWISITEGAPPVPGRYIAYCAGFTGVVRYDGVRFMHGGSVIHVTHWMSMPAPPEA